MTPMYGLSWHVKENLIRTTQRNFEGEVRPLKPRELSSNLSTGTIYGGIIQRLEYPAFNRSIRVRFSVPLPYKNTLA
jgi:hypothetical protein